MSVREIVRCGSALLITGGMMRLPNPGASPKRDTSLFNRVADSGIWLHPAFVLIVLGLLVMFISCWPKRS